MVIVGIQILSQTFTHDKIKTGLPIILGLVMAKKEKHGLTYHISGETLRVKNLFLQVVSGIF
jgi:hypothetical protein